MDLEVTKFWTRREVELVSQAWGGDLKNVPGRIHFVGIGGIGMSALARLLIAKGLRVSGSDKEENLQTRELTKLGAQVNYGHKSVNIDDAGLLVVSTAITDDNPELKAAVRNSIPILHRSQLLACLGASARLIAVSGTHGKTTTTGMIAQVLLDCGLDPSVVIGGLFERIKSNAYLGSGDYFVVEADESDGTHEHAKSYISLITNIEADHLENYPGGIEQIKEVMISFANNSELAAVVCYDDLGCRQIVPNINKKTITYGNVRTAASADYTFENLSGFGMRVRKGTSVLGDIQLSVPGEHNKLNALAALAVGLELGLKFENVASALVDFRGVLRRFQILGQHSGITVIDDYAHHPTEVSATLRAACQYKEQVKAAANNRSSSVRIVAVFQPHQPGRLRDLWDQFCQAFDFADLVLIADVYIARGAPIEGVSSERFANAIRHKDVHYIQGSVSDLPKEIIKYLQEGDLVLTLGAGDITKVGPQLLKLLEQGKENAGKC